MPTETHDRISELLRRTQPGIEVVAAPTPTTKGLFNVGWRAETNRGTYLVKGNSDPNALHEHFVRAADASDMARAHGVRVPRVLASGTAEGLVPADVAGSGPQSYLIQEWLEGRDLEDHLQDASSVEAGRTFREFGALVGNLHNIPYGFGVTPPEALDTRVLARNKLAKLLSRNRDRRELSEGDLVRAETAANRLIGRCDGATTSRLTHHDLHLPNVLVAPDGSVALIDLDFLRPGDPLEDFVKLELWGFARPEHRISFMSGYAETHQAPWPADAALRLHLYRILNSLSYIHFFSVRDPQGVPEWTARLRELLDTATAPETYSTSPQPAGAEGEK